MIVKNDLLTVKTNAVIDSMQYAQFWENGFRMKRIPSQKYLFLTEFEGRTVTYRARFPHFNLWLEWSHSDHALKWKKQGAVTYSTDREKEVCEMFILSLGN